MPINIFTENTSFVSNAHEDLCNLLTPVSLEVTSATGYRYSIQLDDEILGSCSGQIDFGTLPTPIEERDLTSLVDVQIVYEEFIDDYGLAFSLTDPNDDPEDVDFYLPSSEAPGSLRIVLELSVLYEAQDEPASTQWVVYGEFSPG